MSKQAIIRVDSLHFSYDKSLILEQVSFEVKAGQFIGIFGPNGGGKTTLLKLLMGFLEPLTGSITLCEKSPKCARSHLAYVPQIARFDRQFPLTVFDLVKMGLLRKTSFFGSLAKADQEKALEALEKVDLLHKKEAPFGSLSGGEAQRALIARALASNPDILLLDEPTASVDSATEHSLYDILMSLKGKKTILMVSHNLPAMIKRVDECLLINRKATSLAPDALCQHYAVGLYHPPFHQK